MDGVEHLPDQGGPRGGGDAEQGLDLETEELGDRRGAGGSVVGEAFGGLAERLLVDSGVCGAERGHGFQLVDLRGDESFVSGIEAVEEGSHGSGHSRCPQRAVPSSR